MIKYGFLYRRKTFNDVAGLLYVLQDYKIERIGSSTFTLSDDHETFIFSADPKRLEGCSHIFRLEHNLSPEFVSESNMIVSTPAEPIATSIMDDVIVEFLENNLLLTGSELGFTNKNLITEYGCHFYHLYNSLGFRFLNYNQSFTKTNLVGVYYKDTHISGRIMQNRTNLFRRAQKILNNNLVAYPMPETNLSGLLVDYNKGFGMWERIHTPTYTDYMTSVCSIIFETNSVTDNTVAVREHITEKTLKAILFSKAKIFSLLFCSPLQYKYLIRNGFWLLNFEFMEDEEVTEKTIMNSIVKACEYVNNLYNESESLEEVYRQLLASYGDKLEKNSELITKLLNTCPVNTKQRVLDFIRKDNEPDKKQSPNNRGSRLSRIDPRRASYR